MNQNELFKELMEQFISGEITPEGKTMLLEMLDNPQYSEELNSILRDNFDSVEIPSVSSEVTEKFIEELKGKMNASSKTEKTAVIKLFNWKKIAVAASILIAVGIGTFVALQKGDEAPVVVVSKQVNDKAPGKTGAILTLADGSIIVLDSLGNGLVANQNNTTVSKKNGALVYKSGNNSELVYNTMTTPRARQYNLELSDGTKVWLNASSSLTFPTSFASNERKVILTGEAYFEVAKDKKRPFRVSVNEMQVNVLGTHFNINAYDDEATINTTLLEGSVLLNEKSQKVLLKPGQQAQKQKKGTIVVNNKVNIDEVMGWKNGVFYFENAGIQTVLREISRWYDVDVVFEKGIPVRTFEGEIQRNLKLSQVLKILEKNKVHFKIDGNVLRVQP
ncbi:FecR family protein [Flavobacterium flevense]|uniref:Iron dicitrate transporter FecR n=1 Tax=Flavobacterium flevense TaxID=983 RepID=A0A4Y4AY97_9FLAO|nr:FecR family protein [Flavobacterium flevense]GEC71554.1 iron dicitrate transporter FecR [Flavobacterium flevense]SHL50046.1 FecR family protein [Flavobacterium flevense]